ncbi:hypothetical protein LINGRAHAP2_LOCUS16068 [Linum grandiflorum]
MNRPATTKTESSGSSRQPRRCRHGEIAEVFVSNTLENPARQFYRCPLWKEKNADCKYFQWVVEDAPIMETPASSVRSAFRRGNDDHNRLSRDCQCWGGTNSEDFKTDKVMKDLMNMMVVLRAISETQLSIAEDLKELKSKVYSYENGVWCALTVVSATFVLFVAFMFMLSSTKL